MRRGPATRGAQPGRQADRDGKSRAHAARVAVPGADMGHLYAQWQDNASGVERLVERVARKSHRKRCGECHEPCYLCR